MVSKPAFNSNWTNGLAGLDPRGRFRGFEPSLSKFNGWCLPILHSNSYAKTFSIVTFYWLKSFHCFRLEPAQSFWSI